MSFQAEKRLVLDHYAAIAAATPGDVAERLAERTAPGWLWRGMHPFHERTGAEAVAETFWAPFLTAMTRLQRRQDIFVAGRNEIDGFASVWTISMGHLMGLLDAPFLGIPPSRRIAMLRYVEFNRVEDDHITETAFFFDLLHLMRQAGLAPLKEQTGMHLVQPGPMTHDGLLLADADPAEGERTLAVIDAMIADIGRNVRVPGQAAAYDTAPEAELARAWHDDMIWWGPEGVGATYTIPRYVEQHQRPFRTQLTGWTFNGHLCKLAEGAFGGFFGWPNLTVTPTGGLFGMPAGPPGDLRVVDMYRREGDKLAENWIFIDIPHFLNQQGRDVLAEIGGAG